jgi:hypothetical protein
MGPALCSEIKEERAAISRQRGTFAEEGGPRRGPEREDGRAAMDPGSSPG